MFCRSCGKEIARPAAFCDTCGVPLRPPPPETRSRRLAVGLLVLVVPILGVVIWNEFNRPPDTEKPKTDREKDGLIGPVHTIREEQQDGAARKPRRIAVYDRAGNEQEHTVFVDGAKIFKQVFIRGTAGKPVEAIIYRGETESPSHRLAYVYDQSGGATVESAPLPGGATVLPKTFSRYDDRGHMVESHLFNNTGQLIKRSIYSYDSRDRMIKRLDYDVRGSLEETHSWEYDRKGNVGREIHRGIATQYSYDFDPRGNWIKQLAHDSSAGGDDAPRTLYRMISYYPD